MNFYRFLKGTILMRLGITLVMARYQKRLQRELKDFQTNPPTGIEVEQADNLTLYACNGFQWEC